MWGSTDEIFGGLNKPMIVVLGLYDSSNMRVYRHRALFLGVNNMSYTDLTKAELKT